MSRLPYTVGALWFEWVDEPINGRYDGENSNYGVVNNDDDGIIIFFIFYLFLLFNKLFSLCGFNKHHEYCQSQIGPLAWLHSRASCPMPSYVKSFFLKKCNYANFFYI